MSTGRKYSQKCSVRCPLDDSSSYAEGRDIRSIGLRTRCAMPAAITCSQDGVLYRAHGLQSSSILGGHTRPQLSPDLEALPTSGY